MFSFIPIDAASDLRILRLRFYKTTSVFVGLRRDKERIRVNLTEIV